MIRKFRDFATGLGVAGAAFLPMAAWAADEKPKLDTGDTAWMLVLFREKTQHPVRKGRGAAWVNGADGARTRDLRSDSAAL